MTVAAPANTPCVTSFRRVLGAVQSAAQPSTPCNSTNAFHEPEAETSSRPSSAKEFREHYTPGWHYPAITRGRVRFDNLEYDSQPFEETAWRLAADVVIAGQKRGTIEVFYLEEREELDEGPFLTEERNLIDGIARALSETLEHRQAEGERRALEQMGFCVLTVHDRQEALRTFREHAGKKVCVLLDLTMPRMDGEEVFRGLKRIQPDVRTILCSGYNRLDATRRFVGKGLAGFIQKPFTMDSLRAHLMEALGVGSDSSVRSGEHAT